jgi:hypothetical protein
MMTELQAGESGSVDSCAETVRVRVLPEPLCQHRARTPAPARSFDPYNTDSEALPIETPSESR